MQQHTSVSRGVQRWVPCKARPTKRQRVWGGDVCSGGASAEHAEPPPTSASHLMHVTSGAECHFPISIPSPDLRHLPPFVRLSVCLLVCGLDGRADAGAARHVVGGAASDTQRGVGSSLHVSRRIRRRRRNERQGRHARDGGAVPGRLGHVIVAARRTGGRARGHEHNGRAPQNLRGESTSHWRVCGCVLSFDGEDARRLAPPLPPSKSAPQPVGGILVCVGVLLLPWF